MATISKFILVVGAAIPMMATGAFAQSPAPAADRILYDRGIESIEHGHYAAARLILNALVDTYPASDYQGKAKLAIAVSWLRQGDERALARAEAGYKDFILFYPNMKEAAEAEYRDFILFYPNMKEAAEAEYKDFILFYPNMKEAAELQVGEPLRKIREQNTAKPR
jgi:outer membrane protein assembly factor BamD